MEVGGHLTKFRRSFLVVGFWECEHFDCGYCILSCRGGAPCGVATNGDILSNRCEGSKIFAWLKNVEIFTIWERRTIAAGVDIHQCDHIGQFIWIFFNFLKPLAKIN